MDGELWEQILGVLQDLGTQPLDSAGDLLSVLTAGGIDPALLENVDLDQLVQALSSGGGLPECGGDWEYWGNGTYWQVGPDGGYTGNHFGWD